MKAILLADGDVAPRAALDSAWPGWSADVQLVVAVDGGARHAERVGMTIDLWVGDGDSLDPSALELLKAAGVAMERSPSAKDESDTELALLAVLRRGIDDIVVLGGFGGPRLDHALANVALLAHPALVGASVALLDERSRVSLLTAPGSDGQPVRRSLPGPVGGLVSLLPVGGDATGITTSGFAYPLDHEDLVVGPARGLSNVRLRDDAEVRLGSGRLLVVEAAGRVST